MPLQRVPLLRRRETSRGAVRIPILRIAAALAFALVGLLMIALHYALVFSADRSGRVASLLRVAQVLVSAAVPLVGSLVVVCEDARRAALVSAACACR